MNRETEKGIEMVVICMMCKQNTEVPDAMPARVLNFPTVSIVLIEHPEQGICSGCNAVLTIGVAAANMNLVGVPIPKKAEKPVIIMPN